MFTQKSLINAANDSKTYPLGENIECSAGGTAGALVALSHTPLERQLYEAMLLAADALAAGRASFTVRRLTEVTDITSLSTIRRCLEGLAAKLCVEREAKQNVNGSREHAVAYRVFTPEEVLARRNERGVKTYENRMQAGASNRSFERVIQRVVENKNLSRREAQVALCCVEGLTNAEIGSRLLVTEQTVKFHLRNVFVKFGVKRRTELISRLLM
ncbi:MAG TPA: helix-turn-helix transcriptional regulator [Pyrinomonadaceae bacterium]|nr:helix-turn-helix transcriptional regulator [Pyrinomonadaceae bacterium]